MSFSLSMASLNFGLDPSEERLVRSSAVTLRTLLIAWCATHCNMALLLLVCDDWGLEKGWWILWSIVDALRGDSHWPIVSTVGMRCGRSQKIRTVLSAAQVVRLILGWLKSTFIEAKVVVLLASVSTLGLGDSTSDFIWIPKLIKSLVVGRLEIIVYHTSLLLLPKWEVMAFQLSLENAVFLLLCLWILVLLHHKLVFCFRDSILSVLRANFDACRLHLRANFSSIRGFSTFLSLCVNRWSIECSWWLIRRAKAKLSRSHASLQFLPILELVRRDREFALICLVDRNFSGEVIPKREVRFSKVKGGLSIRLLIRSTLVKLILQLRLKRGTFGGSRANSLWQFRWLCLEAICTLVAWREPILAGSYAVVLDLNVCFCRTERAIHFNVASVGQLGVISGSLNDFFVLTGISAKQEMTLTHVFSIRGCV